MLRRPIRTHCMSLHSFRYLSSFISIFQFSSRVRVLLELHLSTSFFGVIVNGIVFLILVSMCSLLYGEIQFIFQCLSCILHLAKLTY